MMLIVFFFSWRGATTVCVSSIYNFPSNFGVVVRSTLLTFICLLFQNWQIREKWAESVQIFPQRWQYWVDVYICFCMLCVESYCSWFENSWSIDWLIVSHCALSRIDWSIVCLFVFGLDCLNYWKRDKPRLKVLAFAGCSLLSAFVVDFIDVDCYWLLLLMLVLLLLFLWGRSPNKVICKVFYHRMSKSLVLLSSCYCFE